MASTIFKYPVTNVSRVRRDETVRDDSSRCSSPRREIDVQFYSRTNDGEILIFARRRVDRPLIRSYARQKVEEFQTVRWHALPFLSKGVVIHCRVREHSDDERTRGKVSRATIFVFPTREPRKKRPFGNLYRPPQRFYPRISPFPCFASRQPQTTVAVERRPSRLRARLRNTRRGKFNPRGRGNYSEIAFRSSRARVYVYSSEGLFVSGGARDA